MQPQDHKNQDASGPASSGRTSVPTKVERRPSSSPYLLNQPSAVDEARQMLDEIAGDEANLRPRRIRRQPSKTKILWLNLWYGLRHRLSAPGQADFRLVREMRQFLKHPGHFFWFNRIAPERAAEHFGTTSTDAMTHHARRYGAHAAMLILAVIVVFFGGFSGLATKLMSPYAEVVDAPRVGGDLLITGDTRELYVSALAGNTNLAMPRRIEVLTVKEGETLRTIAADRNISLDTLLWANEMFDPDTEIKGGQKLIVPPVTGMLHIANPGDTIGKVAEMYGVDPKIIIDYKFNNLDGADASTTLKAMQEVMVPGGTMPQRSKIEMYTVRSGDTLKSLAAKFGLTTDSLTDNNDLDDGLQVGQQIRIMPVDGVLYTVKKGDTLNGVADYLGTKPENIVNFRANNVAVGIPLREGASLIVPGGSWPPPPPPVEQIVPVAPKPKPAVSAPASKPSAAKPAPAVAPLPSHTTTTSKPAAPAPAKPAAPKAIGTGAVSSGGKATGAMIWPMRGIIMTYFGERIWYGIHMGLDISTSCGTPVVAADGGTVVESGWSPYGYGINVVIDHGNGIKTRYAHFSGAAVGVGQRVSRGQRVGYEGTTGNSTGCHLHFEVIVNGTHTDPLRYLR